MPRADDTLERLATERRKIVARYDKGIGSVDDRRQEIPPNKIDRYGFFIDDDCPPRVSEKSHRKTSRSELKWLKMMLSYEQNRQSVKFITRCYKGIPESQRSLVWSKLLGIQTLKSTQKGMYDKMRDRGRECSPEIRQIDLDVNRTFRLNSYFFQRYCQRQQMLFNVLAAYSSYNSEIGYCQGMNNLAAIFTMYFEEEEDVFWGLSQMMTGYKWRMHGFFVQGFPKFIRFDSCFKRIMELRLPSLLAHLESLGVTTFTYLVKWFMNCFIDVVPFSLTLRFFDVYLMEGETILLVMAFTILDIHQDALFKLKSIDHILDFIGVNRLARNFCGVGDDHCMRSLRANLLLLQRLHLLPEPSSTPQQELPRRPFAPEHTLSKEEIVRRASKSNNWYLEVEDNEITFSREPEVERYRRMVSRTMRKLVIEDSEIVEGPYLANGDVVKIECRSTLFEDEAREVYSQTSYENVPGNEMSSDSTSVSIYDNSSIFDRIKGADPAPMDSAVLKSKGTEVRSHPKLQVSDARTGWQTHLVDSIQGRNSYLRRLLPSKSPDRSSKFEEYSF